MRITERIEHFLNIKNISKNAFDIAIGASNGYIGKQIKNNASIGSDVIEKIVCMYGLNPNWLILGEGDMMLSNTESLSKINTPPKDDSSYKEKYFKLLEELNVLKSELLEVQKKLHALELEKTEKERESGPATDTDVGSVSA